MIEMISELSASAHEAIRLVQVVFSGPSIVVAFLFIVGAIWYSLSKR